MRPGLEFIEMKHSLSVMAAIAALALVAPVIAGCDFPGFGASGGQNQHSTGAAVTPIAKGTPGVLTSENPAADEAMEAIKSEGVPMATEKEGGQPLAFRMEGGVKVFELTAKAVSRMGKLTVAVCKNYTRLVDTDTYNALRLCPNELWA